MTPESALTALASKHPLPEGWSRSEAFLDRFVADGLELHRAGLSALGPEHQEVNGAACALDASPVARAYFELVERACTLTAIRDPSSELPVRGLDGAHAGMATRAEVLPESDEPAVWRYARSNGVALHATWFDACHRALWELAERDRVLRAWCGELCPEPIGLPADTPLLEGAPSFAWSAYRFPVEGDAAWSEGIEVTGVFGFPRAPGLPLVHGYGARPELADALASAAMEATQLLGFLWGEPLPDRPPELAPCAPFHLEHFLFPETHATLRRWLEGAHRTLARPRSGPVSVGVGGDAASVRFVDLSPGRETGLFVAKAVCAAAVPLAFGRSPWTAHLPEALRVHPIA